VEQEIRETLGLVPGFFARIPDEILDHEWTRFQRYEFEDAVHYAKHTVGWSTCLNGIRRDFDEFENELKEIGEYLGGGPRIPAVKVAAGV
jgi:hypothetical protein